MSELEDERRALIDFLQSLAKPGQTIDNIDDDEHLFASGALDSLAILEIIVYLEQNYGIDVPGSDIDPASLVSIKGILETITRS